MYRRWIEEIFRKKNLRAVKEFISPSLVDRAAPPGVPQGIEGVKQGVGMYLEAFPDIDVNIKDLIAEGDKVVSHLTAGGTHRGNLMGIAPTGKKIIMAGIDMVRIDKGKIVEHWQGFDMLGLMQQLGAVRLAGQD